MAYNFSETSKRKIHTFLTSLKKELYDISTKVDVSEVMRAIPDGNLQYAYCQCYIIKFYFKGMIFFNGYRDFDLMHICTKKDNSGLINYIKIYPEKNLKTNILIDKVKQTGNLFGLNICKVEEDTEHDNSSIVKIIKLYVV